MAAVYNLQILRGLDTNRNLLSCTPEEKIVDLFNHDDGSGRQQWEFNLVPGEINVYNIKIVKGASTNRVFLSCTESGDKVDLWDCDDGSGRQRWELIPMIDSPTPNTYLIRIADGVSTNNKLLSCTPNGLKVDLFDHDDGSGRQRWQIQKSWETN